MEPTIERSTRPKKITLIVEDAPKQGLPNGRRGGGLLRLTVAAVAGYALYRRVANRSRSLGRNAIHLSKSVVVERPVGEVFRFWRNLENLPRSMSHLESVRVLPNGRSRWTAKGPAGSKVEWDAETLVERQDEIISWRSVEGADVPNEGTVRFKDLGGQRTEVKVSLTYHPPGGAIGAGIAKLFGEEPSQQVEADLQRFKREFESGGAMRHAGATGANPMS